MKKDLQNFKGRLNNVNNHTHTEFMNKIKNIQISYDKTELEFKQVLLAHKKILEELVVYETKRRQMRERIMYSACKLIRKIADAQDPDMLVHIFCAEKFLKCYDSIKELCAQLNFHLHLAAGNENAADNNLIFVLRNILNHEDTSVYLFTSDRALIVYATYLFINESKINFHIFMQDGNCSPYISAWIRYYNLLENTHPLSNIYFYNHNFSSVIDQNVPYNTWGYHPSVQPLTAATKHPFTWYPWNPKDSNKPQFEWEGIASTYVRFPPREVYSFKKHVLRKADSCCSTTCSTPTSASDNDVYTF